MDDYAKALSLGNKQVKDALSKGEDPYPPVLDELIDSVGHAGKVSLGLINMPLHLVVGTSTRGRKNLFSRGFMPLADPGSEFSVKWSSLVDAQKDEGIREPVVAYEYLQRFYIQEGNKRVSVARYLGMSAIEAEVTRVLPKESSDEDYQRYQEFLRFYDATHVYGLEFSEVGSYEKFMRLLGHSLDDTWEESDLLHMRAALARFSQAFDKALGSSPDCTMGDALLVYLRFYPASGSFSTSTEDMEKGLMQLQGSLLPKKEPVGIKKVGGKVVSKAKDVVHHVSSKERS